MAVRVRVLEQVSAQVSGAFIDRRRRLGILLVLPSVVVILGVLIYPLGYSLVISLYDLNVTTPWLPRSSSDCRTISTRSVIPTSGQPLDARSSSPSSVLDLGSRSPCSLLPA